MPLLAEPDRVALSAAAEDVEARSAAEVVIVVRRQAGSYFDVDLLAGIVAGLLLLWYQLFAPAVFSLGSIFWGPPALGAVVAAVVGRWPAARRLLTSAERRRRGVHEAACAAFVDRGIDATRARTGILVHVSLLERAVEVLADRGVHARVPKADWEAQVAGLREAAASGAPLTAVAAQVRSMGNLLATALPRAEDDVDELGDEVVA